MNERQIKLEIIERARQIAKILMKGHDVEIRRDKPSGIKVLKIKKEEV